MMRSQRVLITWLVIGWTLLFHYESLRAHYLSPLLHRELPKLPLLFPPAGWIMFYQIDPTYGFAEVRGLQGSTWHRLDPHTIFTTRALGYDNIHRNVLVGVLSRTDAGTFCRYLRRKFPQYEAFAVLYGQHPDLINAPDTVRYQLAYHCP